MVKVVSARAAELGGELGRPAARQLLRVHPQPQTRDPGGLEDGAGLGDGERALVAEHVAPPGTMSHRGGQLPHDFADVLLTVAVGRDDVRPEVGRRDPRAGQRAGDVEQPELVVRRQSVAALDLHRRGAGHHGGVNASLGQRRSADRCRRLGSRRRSRRSQPGRYDAPASRPTTSSRRLPAHTAWVWQSTKPGSTAAPAASISATSPRSRRQLPVGTDPRHPAVADHDRCVGEPRLRPGRQPTDPADDEIAHSCQAGACVPGSSGIRTPTSRAVSSAMS